MELPVLIFFSFLLHKSYTDHRVDKGVVFRKLNNVRPTEDEWQVVIRFDASPLYSLQGQVSLLSKNLESTKQDMVSQFLKHPFLYELNETGN